ncbi:MAG: HlyC/CorC family transporter [Chitinophagaceae bacterium]|nr:HlyC/CorC family transporter [Oligoflexus sp.]
MRSQSNGDSSMLLFVFAIIVLLVAANALYVGAEFAAVSVRKSAIKQLAVEGNTFAKRVLPILEDGARLDRYVATCQIGITISSLVLGAFAEYTLASRLAPIFEHVFSIQHETAVSAAVVVILVGLAVLQMVLAELVPKTIAMHFPTRTLLLTYVPIAWSTFLFRGLIVLFNGCATLLLKSFGFQTSTHRHIHTSDELAILLAQVHEEGVLDPDEHARLQRALSLDAWSAAELMVARRSVEAIDRHAPISEIIKDIAKSPYTRLPVYEGTSDNVVMILHTKDVVAEIAAHGELRSIEPMLRPLIAVPEVMKADKLLNLMRRKRVQMVSIIDEYGTFVGIVTVEDILSEVFGAIGDEFKAGQPLPEVVADGRVRLPGMMRPDEAQQWIGVLWKGDSNTIAGLVTEALKMLPSPGDRVMIGDLEVEVEEVEERVVRTVLVKLSSVLDKNEGKV